MRETWQQLSQFFLFQVTSNSATMFWHSAEKRLNKSTETIIYLRMSINSLSILIKIWRFKMVKFGCSTNTECETFFKNYWKIDCVCMCTSVCMRVCVCVQVCVGVRARASVCMRVCVWERETVHAEKHSLQAMFYCRCEVTFIAKCFFSQNPTRCLWEEESADSRLHCKQEKALMIEGRPGASEGFWGKTSGADRCRRRRVAFKSGTVCSGAKAAAQRRPGAGGDNDSAAARLCIVAVCTVRAALI